LACLSLLFPAIAWVKDNIGSPTPDGPPEAKRECTEETVNGHKVSDLYRWLEDANSPTTQDYVRRQLAYTRRLLDPLPGRDRIRKRLTELLATGTIGTPQIAGKYYFYTRRTGEQNQPVLLVRDSLHGEDRVLLDVNGMASDGTVALDWWFPSDDGIYVAYGISSGGSEESMLGIVETASLRLLPDSIGRTRFASVTWKKDNSGFYYTRRPKKGDVPAGEEAYHVKVFYHSLGSEPEGDQLVFGEQLHAQAMPSVQLAADDDRWLVISVAEGWTKSEIYLQDLEGNTQPIKLTTGKNFLYSAEVCRDRLYIVSNEDSPQGCVFLANVENPKRENWKTLIPASDAVLQNISVVGGQLLALYEKNATSLLRQFDLSGRAIGEPRLPKIGSVFGIGGRWNRDEAFIGFHSFTVPPTIFRLDMSSGQLHPWDQVLPPNIKTSDYEVDQIWFTSKDGTKVPMFVVHKRALRLNGRNPTLLNGYGGFNISLTPTFAGGRYLWLEHGGVLAVANLRGGAEFGEDWHRAGMLENKQNVFDDFISGAEYLISAQYTDKEHLAIQGGSNGGLLMGAVFTQRPDLCRAVVCQVPLLDMLRYQHFQIAKLWIPEYGSADDPDQFRWLHAYSPYHRVRAGTEYPAILFVTADGDTRVDPMHAKKMTALMQAEAANGQNRERPILLRIDSKAGHGAGKPIVKQIDEGTDIYSFLFWQLEVEP
jgi:prolyl oligopeptidase